VLDGEAAVPCNLQSAIARLKSYLRLFFVILALVSGDDVWVLRNKSLRIPSGPEGSSGKHEILCAVGIA